MQLSWRHRDLSYSGSSSDFWQSPTTHRVPAVTLVGCYLDADAPKCFPAGTITRHSCMSECRQREWIEVGDESRGSSALGFEYVLHDEFILLPTYRLIHPVVAYRLR